MDFREIECSFLFAEQISLQFLHSGKQRPTQQQSNGSAVNIAGTQKVIKGEVFT
jgi:hypothetical protein